MVLPVHVFVHVAFGYMLFFCALPQQGNIGLAVCRKAQKADGELRRVTADLRAHERERNAAESRAAAAQAETEKGSSASTALAAAKRVSVLTPRSLRMSLALT